MRSAVSIVLATILVTLPLEQAFAQAALQDSTNVGASLVQERGPTNLIRVPALTPETARLWETMTVKPRTEPPPVAVKALIIGWVILVIAVFILYIVYGGECEECILENL